MQDLIQRLKSLVDSEDNSATSEELNTIIAGLERLDQEHTRQTDDLRGLREEREEINTYVNQTRRKLNVWEDEISSIPDDISSLLTEISDDLIVSNANSAALRAVLEKVRTTARKAEDDPGDFLDPRDLLGSVAHQSAEGLKEHNSGAKLREGIRQLENIIEVFELGMRETGGWTYGSDRTLAERVQRCMDHYTRMAAQAVSDSHGFKDGTVSWLRGIAINAQAVSWGSTHHEKDARLRGLIEVIETAITKIDERRVDDRLSRWNGVVDSWQKSDFPTREMRRRIFDLEAEVNRLKKAAGESTDNHTSPDIF